MAALILSALGSTLGRGAAGFIGATLGRVLGAAIGGRIDNALFGETRRVDGPRMDGLHLQASMEGASIPAIYGRARIAGQVIWAARFTEHVNVDEVESGGKGGGASTEVTTYSYSLSFAVGLCEGIIARIGRVWANGEPLDLSEFSYRLYRGDETQTPDALIEAIEGTGAPAYRGLAYIVFEDLPLARFGNGIPQLSFEIIRPTLSAGGARLEDMVRGVCLIPGAGEFVYATQPVRRVLGPGRQVAENTHAEAARANLLVSLDHLQADLPACEFVLLVVAWFGNDLRVGECTIRPGVELANKTTTPITWRAGSVTRAGAHVVSQHDGAPAFGGTPSDDTVIAAIQEIKARGLKVGLYPFILMDVPHGNALPDPYGGAAQAAYPWRGRMTVTAGADKTAAAGTQVSHFFGAAAASDFGVSGGAVTYSGPAEWSFRRFILHYAKLAALAGGVDAFILGSELRGITTARSNATTFPAVAALKTLAADVRGLLGGATKLTYAADWSEYRGHQPQDGSGDVFFHLDPLWADANIDCVGADWYPPLSDWRDGATHLDYALSRNEHQPAYLRGRIEAGENYDWYYADEDDRAAQVRTDIVDAVYGEPWVFRAKDVRRFWANAHHNRPGGVRSGSATAWVPQSKPIWFVEFGCAAIDKGANAPNLFLDPKSSESAAPPFSSGAPDDLIQRRTLEAYLGYWGGAANPTSSVDGRKMIDLEGAFVWCWDARPHPAFPARTDVWADGSAWRRGHWLNGRAGLAPLADVVASLNARAGVIDADVSGLSGIVSGYVVDAPASARAALEPLMAAYAFFGAERDGALTFAHGADIEPVALTLNDLAADSIAAPFRGRGDSAEAPIEARVRFLDGAADYRIGAASARRRDAADGGVETIDAPLVLDASDAEAMAERLLSARRATQETADVRVGPALLALEPGDRVAFQGETFEIARIEDGPARQLTLQRAESASRAPLSAAAPSVVPSPPAAPTPAFAVLDLPPLPGSESDDRPLAALAATPWLGAHQIYANDTRRGEARFAATVGELLWALYPGPTHVWDQGNRIRVKLYAGALESVTSDAALAGQNVFAVEGDAGEWEILCARDCVLVGADEYELSGFLRGLLDSSHAMGAPTPVGRRIVKLDQRLARVAVNVHEWGAPLTFVAPPAGKPSTDAGAATETAPLAHVALRPFRPAHLRAERVSGGDVVVTWIRQARLGGASWEAGEPPVGETSERYVVEVLDGGGAVVRSAEVTAESWTYSAALQSADFGSPPSVLHVRAAQIASSGAPGLKTQAAIPL